MNKILRSRVSAAWIQRLTGDHAGQGPAHDRDGHRVLQEAHQRASSSLNPTTTSPRPQYSA